MLRTLILAIAASVFMGAAAAGPIQGFLTPANDGSTATAGRILEFGASDGQFVRVVSPAQGVSQIGGMTYGPDGSLYASYWDALSNANGRVLRISPDGAAAVFVSPGSGGLQVPLGLTFGPDGNLYIASNQGGVLRFDGQTGASLGTFATAGLSVPQDLLFGTDGRLYVSNGAGNSISRYDGLTGDFLGYLAAPNEFGLAAPIGLTAGAGGDLYVASFPTNRIFRFNTVADTLVSVFDLPGRVDGLDTLLDLALGPDQRLYATVRSSEGGTDFLKLNADTGEVLGVFAHMDSPNSFNTGMLFVDSGCSSLGAASGQASGCFAPVQVAEPGTLPMAVLAAFSAFVVGGLRSRTTRPTGAFKATIRKPV